MDQLAIRIVDFCSRSLDNFLVLQGADVVVIKKLKDGSKNITSDLLHNSAQSVTTPVPEVPGPELTTEVWSQKLFFLYYFS